VVTGSFNKSFYAIVGTDSDAPVLNYTVVKGSAN